MIDEAICFVFHLDVDVGWFLAQSLKSIHYGFGFAG